MDKNRPFYAKSKRADGSQPTVSEHLEKVSELAAEFGKEIGCEQEARIAGKFHDFGKYSESFQNRLTEVHGSGSGIDHAICGAAILKEATKTKNVKGGMTTAGGYIPVIEAVNGHHGGLKEYGEIKNKLEENLKSKEPIEQFGKYSALSGKDQYLTAYREFQKDFPGFKLPRISKQEIGEPKEISAMLFTRMLFSCLVDADYSISASDDDPNYLEESQDTVFDALVSLDKLYSYREGIRAKSSSDKKLNLLRDAVFEQCGNAGAESPEGLFTLTAPTGVGKTLALLHFALWQCVKTEKKRIIIVLPFLTLTEQNAETYRHIFPNLLEDHSQRDLDDRERIFAERWSSPFIITTSVRFFETLFAWKPADCRKLHHIANSVVVFDEAQTLPAEVTSCTLYAVNELCRKYHCTMIFSTATQPDFDMLRKVCWKPREIVQDNEVLYRELARTYVEWRIGSNTSFERIAKEMSQRRSVCAIVNLRKHARKLYLELGKVCGKEGIFYLTTDLCMSHRREIVKKIKKRLDNREPCRVVSTQCIEAGVDLDFETVYRSLAPLESIIQAAGRCNRNGLQKEKGKVIVFKPDEEGSPYPGGDSGWYAQASQKVEYLLHNHVINIHDPSSIREYYRLLYAEAEDKPDLQRAIRNKNYEEVDNKYQLITDRGYRVIVPYEGCKEEFINVRSAALTTGLTPGLIRRAAGFTVSAAYTKEEQLEIIAEPVFYPGSYSNKRKISDQKSAYYILRSKYKEQYTDDMGLQIPENIEIDPFF